MKKLLLFIILLLLPMVLADIQFQDDADTGTYAGKGWTGSGSYDSSLSVSNPNSVLASSGDNLITTNQNMTGANFPVTAAGSFYDDGTSSANAKFVMFTSAAGSGCNHDIELGITSPSTHYFIREPGCAIVKDGSVSRTTAWHTFNITYKNSTWITISVDGTIIYDRVIASAVTPQRFAMYAQGGVTVRTDDIVITNASAPVPLTIINSTYNLTSGIDVGNQSLWSTDNSSRATVNDTSPSVTFNTTANAICAVGSADENLSTMMAGDGALCNENSDNSTTIPHTCTTGFTLNKSANNSMFIACGTESSGYVDNGLVSDSGELKMFVSLFTITGFVLDELANGSNTSIVHIFGVDSNDTLISTHLNSTAGYSVDVDATGTYFACAWDPTNTSRKPDGQAISVT